MYQPKSLHQKIQDISSVFDINRILNIPINTITIAKYYRINKFTYRLFHNREDFIHMGISEGEKFKTDDLLAQAKFIESYISKGANSILELATGRGATAIYLAKKFPNIKFYGLDLANGQIEIAFQKANKVKNFFPQIGNFHHLSDFEAKSFDLVFIIEALCHTTKKEVVIKEVSRVLKPNGIFIIIDGYIEKPQKDLTREELLAKQLTEIGMYIENFEPYTKLKNLLNKNNFLIIKDADKTTNIIPSLKRLEKQAYFFFRLPKIIKKLIINSLPPEFTNNTLSAYLMLTLVDLKIASYKITVAKKVRD